MYNNVYSLYVKIESLETVVPCRIVLRYVRSYELAFVPLRLVSVPEDINDIIPQ